MHRNALFAAAFAATLFLSAFPTGATSPCDGVSTAPETGFRTVRVASGLTKPCWVTAPVGDTHRIFILEQDGRVRIVKDGLLLAASFLDVSAITRSPVDGGGNEQGLLGLAFSPSYDTDGLFFIYHTDTGGTTNTLARYHVSANPDLADTSTRTAVLTVPHPTNTNHNGGDLAFGPDDGFLYLTTGDGGGACDTPGNAQNTNSLLGKLLRIDVIPAPVPPNPPYRIPSGNAGFSTKEIFSYGLRNPWRYSFDRQTHDLYIGDVGQGVWEEVDFRPFSNLGSGVNYGWDHYEGFACPSPSCSDPSCVPLSPRVDPVKVYDHSSGKCSITGGYVYRGCRMPGLASQGRYLYSDFCLGNIESFVYNGSVTSELTLTSQLSPSVDGFAIGAVTTFGEDARGEVYIADRGGLGGTAGQGEIFKIVPTLPNLEVSGANAASFLLGADWTWENIWVNSSYPVDQYRVYRNDGNGSGTFVCVFKTGGPVAPARGPIPVWSGGDPATPLPGTTFSYIVTAVYTRPGPVLEESSPGKTSSGTPHVLSPVACP
jgi:glucose/arabinose dehydrogenase